MAHRPRTIFHVDMDAFFVAVEELYDPRLRGLPVIVGGAPDGRGVVAAASYEARRFGVHSAMPIARARRLCPQAVFLRGRFERYRLASQRVFSCFDAYSPDVEALGLDEAYLDLTGCERLLGHPMAVASRLQREIRCETGLACSIGVASTRLVAKVASDLAKPKGVLRVVPGAEEAFLAPLALERLPGVGPATASELRALGLKTVGDLAALKRGPLERTFGQAAGASLWRRARGLDSPISFAPRRELPKSIGRERTLGEDVMERGFVEATLSGLLQRSVTAMRSLGLEARTVTVKLRYSNFSTATRRATLPEATSDEGRLEAEAVGLLRALDARRLMVRLVGVSLSGFAPARRQMELFDPSRLRRWALSEGLDIIRSRYGDASALTGRAIALVGSGPANSPLAGPSNGVGRPGERFGRVASEEPRGFGPPGR